jgi:hypothetical protein
MAKGKRTIKLPSPEATQGDNMPETEELNQDTTVNPEDVSQDSEPVELPADPPLPAGIAKGSLASKPATTSSGAASENNEEESPAQQHNKLARQRSQYVEKARELGDAKIKGERSLLALAELALNGGREGLLTVDSDPKENDAKKLYEAFISPNSGLKKPRYSEPERNEASLNSNIKKIEWFIKLGYTFRDDGVRLFNMTHDEYKVMMTSDEVRKSMKYTAAYEAVLSVVRTFMMAAEAAAKAREPMPDLPTTENIHNFLLKDEKQPKDAIQLLIDAYKTIDKAQEGDKEQTRPGLKDDRLEEVLRTLGDVIKGQGEEAEKRLKVAITPPVKKAKKGDGEATDTGEASKGDEQPSSDAEPTEEAPDPTKRTMTERLAEVEATQ